MIRSAELLAQEDGVESTARRVLVPVACRSALGVGSTLLVAKQFTYFIRGSMILIIFLFLVVYVSHG